MRSETESADLQYFKYILLHEDDEDSLQSLRIKTLSLVNDLYFSIYTCENQDAKHYNFCSISFGRRAQRVRS